MNRVILIVLDGCGVGAMPDAALYGDSDPQSATLPHVAEAIGGLSLPTLQALGLGNIVPIRGLSPVHARGGWGRLAEASAGKDSVTGHWELMGIVTETAFPTYPHGFPVDVMADFEARIGRGTLGNMAGSGTEMLKRFGAEHLATGKPIVYTSADSVFQIAAHESIVPLAALYEMCAAARELLVPPNNILRVIARPFSGGSPDSFRRTENRRDFPLAPPEPNCLARLQAAGKTVHAIGVVADLFPRTYFARAQRTQTNTAHLAAILEAVRLGQEDFVFANCEDFDMLFGHRNDPAGFAACLEEFDSALGEIIEELKTEDLLILTADHGNDPTTVSTDHSREYVPLMIYGGGVVGDLGAGSSFGEVGRRVEEWLLS